MSEIWQWAELNWKWIVLVVMLWEISQQITASQRECERCAERDAAKREAELQKALARV